MPTPSSDRPSGLPHAIAAYGFWGLMPIYLHALKSVPALEFVGWRLVFTLPVALLLIALRRQGREMLGAIGNPRMLGLLLTGALLIGSNWLVYAMAVQSNHVLATSLGYYINPLMNVLAGTVFLGERLTRMQWAAVALATAGVSLLAWDGAEMLGIAMTLAITFAGYGLVRRSVTAGPVPALAIETAMLVPVAICILVWQAGGPGISIGRDTHITLLLALSGVLTAAPLLLFATAARRMDYSTLGFVQYLAPTTAFFLSLFVFHEPLREIQLACFVIIWTAIGLFVWDALARRRHP